MPLATIVLKNAANVDQTYTLAGVSGNVATYYKAGSTLLAKSVLTLTLVNNKGTNRVIPKLSIPTVGTNPSTGLPSVQYTEIGSSDLTSVLAASAADALDFHAQFASLLGHAAVKTPYTTGTFA